MRDDLVAVEALQPDHHQPGAALFRRQPGAVVVRGDARADRLHQEPHRLVAHGGKALDAQHARGLGGGGDQLRQRLGIVDLGQRHDEALELVVVVIELVVVMGLAVLDVGLGADVEPEQRRHIDLAARDLHDLHGARQRAGHRRRCPVHAA